MCYSGWIVLLNNAWSATDDVQEASITFHITTETVRIDFLFESCRECLRLSLEWCQRRTADPFVVLIKTQCNTVDWETKKNATTTNAWPKSSLKESLWEYRGFSSCLLYAHRKSELEKVQANIQLEKYEVFFFLLLWVWWCVRRRGIIVLSHC